MKNRDAFTLEKISQYCFEIAETVKIMELTKENIDNNFIAKNGITMCILTIGELANNLTDEFKDSHNKLPWKDIVNMRHRAAHGYWKMDSEIIWITATEKIPELKEFCDGILKELP